MSRPLSVGALANGRPSIGAAIITRDNLPELKQLLAQLCELDQVVVLDTGSRDGTRKHVRALGSPFELHEFRWRPRPDGLGPDDWGFGAARNESFRHLKTDYGVWLDSDDVVVAIGEGRPVAASPEATAGAFRKLAADSPEVDMFLIDYIYATDEFHNPISVLGKERLLKLSTGWRWRHPIHEILVPERKAVRDVVAVGVRDVAVAHRPNDIQASVRRNGPMLRAWLRQIERLPDVPDADLARARFLVGRSFFALGEYNKAAQWLLGKFLGRHPLISSEDKWQGWMEVAKCLMNANDLEGARHATLQAIGLCPRLGEAYVVLADVKSRTGERPGDVLKLLELAASCGPENYGTNERNPMLTGFKALMLGSESQFRVGRYGDALALADRAMAMRPQDLEARMLWEKAADAAKAKLDSTSTEPSISSLGSGKHDAPRAPAPVFVVSSGRCGSTLVSNMLRLHPDVLSLSEFMIMLSPGIFPAGGAPIYGPQFWALLSTPRKRMTAMLRHGIVFDEVLYKVGPGKRFTAETGVPPILLTALPHLTSEPEALYDEIREFVLAQGPHPVGRHYLLLFDWLRERFHRKVWVERSGSLLVHLEELMHHLPDARFVHMYRDGRECAISMSKHSAFRLSVITGRLIEELGVDPYNTDEPPRAEVPPELVPLMPETLDPDVFWSYPVPLETLGASWQTAETRAVGLLAQLPFGRVHQLRYENLVTAPERELQALTRFVGLPEPPKEFLAAAAALVRTRPPAWPSLAADQRARLDQATRFAMGLLYGSEALTPTQLEPAAV